MFENYDSIITVEELCEILDISKSTGYGLLRAGTIKAFKIGKKWKIPTNSLEGFILLKISQPK